MSSSELPPAVLANAGTKRAREEEGEGAPADKRSRRHAADAADTTGDNWNTRDNRGDKDEETGEGGGEGCTQPAQNLMGPVYPVSDDPAVVAEFNRALRTLCQKNKGGGGKGGGGTLSPSDAVLCAVPAAALGHYVESVGRFAKELCFVPVVADASSAGLVSCVLGSANTTILNGFFSGPVAGFGARGGGEEAARTVSVPGAIGSPTSVSLGKGGRFPGALGLCGTGNSGKVLLTVRPEAVGIVPVHTVSSSGSGSGSGSSRGGGKNIYVRTSATVACIKGERPFFYQNGLPGTYAYGILMNPVLFNDLISKITNGAALQESVVTVQLIRYQDNRGSISSSSSSSSYILALSGHLDAQSSCETWIPSVSSADPASVLGGGSICDFSFTAGSPVDSRIRVSSCIIDFRSSGSGSGGNTGGGERGGTYSRRADSPTTTADIFNDGDGDGNDGEDPEEDDDGDDPLSSCKTIEDVMGTLRNPCVVVSQLYSSKLLRDALHPTGNAGYGLGAEFSVFLTNALPIVLQTVTGDGVVIQTLVQYRDDDNEEDNGDDGK